YSIDYRLPRCFATRSLANARMLGVFPDAQADDGADYWSIPSKRCHIAWETGFARGYALRVVATLRAIAVKVALVTRKLLAAAAITATLRTPPPPMTHILAVSMDGLVWPRMVSGAMQETGAMQGLSPGIRGANLSWPIGASHGHLWPYVEPELLLMHGARTSICFVFCGQGLVQIPPRSVKTLPKTIYEMDLNLLRFLWSRARSDTPTLREDAPQNHLRNGQGLVELGPQSASFSDLNLLRFLWSRARSDTPTLREDAPQNRLQNGQGLVELGPQSASFSVVKGSFGYPHAP
ncbi:uncharacterized protein LACBIDRAFT_335661, partial [Laccaria bicolor S238N-H82]